MVGEETSSIKAKWVAKIEWFQWFIKHCPLNPHFSLKKKDVKETGRVFFCFSFRVLGVCMVGGIVPLVK